MLVTIVVAAMTALFTCAASFFLARFQLRREFQLDYKAEEAVQKLLKQPNWEMRSFKKIERHLGGFKDDELRKILVQAGAVRFYREDNTELWGLLEKVKDKIQ